MNDRKKRQAAKIRNLTRKKQLILTTYLGYWERTFTFEGRTHTETKSHLDPTDDPSEWVLRSTAAERRPIRRGFMKQFLAEKIDAIKQKAVDEKAALDIRTD